MNIYALLTAGRTGNRMVQDILKLLPHTLESR